MNYVVVDFEWNQACYGKGSENRKIPFEIIEIGAVKLDENLKEIDRFSRTIRPKVYKKLHYITRDLTGITQEELCASDPFSYVLVDFMLWCGKDYIFLHMGQYGPGGIAAQHEILWPVGSFEGAGQILQRAEVFSITLCA